LVEIVLFFELHQPRRFRRQFGRTLPLESEKLEDIYFDDELNREVFERVARKSYIPGLKNLIQGAKEGRFKCALGLSGIFLEQCTWWSPEVLELIRELVGTGACELTAQTYFHSLASMINAEEFREQVDAQRKVLKDLFNVSPSAVENTEFIYSNEIAKMFENMGFKVVLTEGVERILGWRSPNFLYKAKGANVSVLMRNYRLSDDIGFRFTSRDWSGWPLTAEKYSEWLSKINEELVFLALDFETFGEHHWTESGIHNFLRALPREVKKYKWLEFATPTEAAKKLKAADEVDVPEAISWADLERDTSAWLANEMQRHCFDVLRYIEPMAKSVGNKFLRTWRLFTTSDHYHYMSTKGGGAGAVHSYFSHYNSPIEGFLTFTWVLTDFRYRVYTAMGDKARYYRMLLGDLPESHAFHFYTGFARPLGLSVKNLNELREAAKNIDKKSLEFHIMRGDLSRWTREVLGCTGLPPALDRLREKPLHEDLREKILMEIDRSIKDAEVHLYGKETERLEAEKVH
jgi:alpha-amylase